MNNSVFCEIILITEVLETNYLFLMKEQEIDSLIKYLSWKEKKKKKKKKGNSFNRLNLMNGWNLEKNS